MKGPLTFTGLLRNDEGRNVTLFQVLPVGLPC
jgi:hypothetical protein